MLTLHRISKSKFMIQYEQVSFQCTRVEIDLSIKISKLNNIHQK